MGFVGGGDIHDGRPGDAFHNESYPPAPTRTWPAGYTAAFAASLTRDAVFDAIKSHRTYATTQTRIYLDVHVEQEGQAQRVSVTAASEEGIREAAVVVNGSDVEKLRADGDRRVIEGQEVQVALGPEDFVYVRITTETGQHGLVEPMLARRSGVDEHLWFSIACFRLAMRRRLYDRA